MTESKPEQSAAPEHTGDEPDTTTRPVSEESPADGSDTPDAAPTNGERVSPSNGHQSDVPPRLPPPWERVPAESTAPSGGDTGSGAGAGDGSDGGYAPGTERAGAWDGTDTDHRDPDHHGDYRDYGESDYRDTGHGGSDDGYRGSDDGYRGSDDGYRGSDDGYLGSDDAAEPDVERGSVPGTPIGRGVADLGDARTVGVDARVGAGIGGLGGGFGSGSSSGSGSAPAGRPGMGTPGGFPAAWPRNRRPRQANLQLKRLDPWSVLKIALVLSVVLYLVWMVAVGVLYGALDGIGVWERLNGQYSDLVAERAGDKLISAGRIFGFAAVVGAVNSLLVAVAFSVAAFIYNVSADMVGGIEVTLSERD